MAGREGKVTENEADDRPVKSAGFRRNPAKHAGTVAIGRKKAPTENSWGFNSGGGVAAGTKTLLKVRKTGVPASCGTPMDVAKSGA